MLPFGADYQRIRACEGFVPRSAKLQIGLLRVKPPRFLHGLGIIGLNPGARVPERFEQDSRGCFPHVVSVWFESKAPDGKSLAGNIFSKVLFYIAK